MDRSYFISKQQGRKITSSTNTIASDEKERREGDEFTIDIGHKGPPYGYCFSFFSSLYSLITEDIIMALRRLKFNPKDPHAPYVVPGFLFPSCSIFSQGSFFAVNSCMMPRQIVTWHYAQSYSSKKWTRRRNLITKIQSFMCWYCEGLKRRSYLTIILITTPSPLRIGKIPFCRQRSAI